MNETVSENAKFNVTKTPRKISETGDLEIHKITINKFVNGSVRSCTPDMDVYEAAKLLIKKGWTGVPIVDDCDCLVGYLSAKDILKHAYASKYDALPPAKVRDFMSTEITNIECDTEIFEVVDMFINNFYQAYPVTKKGKYVGVIFRSEILKAVCNLKDNMF
jgi:predicted transcriptional regulator